MKLELNKRNGILVATIVILLAAMFLFAKKADTADENASNASNTSKSGRHGGIFVLLFFEMRCKTNLTILGEYHA